MQAELVPLQWTTARPCVQLCYCKVQFKVGSLKASIMLYYSVYRSARYVENAQQSFIYEAHEEAEWN